MTLSTQQISFELNGTAQTVRVHPMSRLLDVIREGCGLTGTKEGCGEGECGACSVLIDGQLVNSCLVPTAQVQGCRVETIEGLAADSRTSALADAFIAKGGAQCGICTPGMMLAAAVLLRDNADPSEAEVRTAIAGNLCRCTGYVRIVESIVEASRLVREGAGGA